jgi:type I restriction enzyme S subunit
MSRYKAYPEYKDSGVEWIGDIPKDWDMWKIFHACPSIGSGTTPKSDSDDYYGGDIPWVTTGELREGVVFETQKSVTEKALVDMPTLRLHPKGSVAIAMYGATIGRLGVLGNDATTNQACCVMPPSEVLHGKYLFYWLYANRQEIINLSSGGGQPNVNQEKISSLKVSAPSNFLQGKIVTFLDHETAKIDALIEKQQRLIELLKEKRQAVISHAVTKGLNPDAPMKDSGVEWLGEVPAHWVVKRLKHISPKIGVGLVINPSTYTRDEGVYFIFGGDVKEHEFDLSNTRKISSDDSNSLLPSRLNHRDLVCVRVGYPGVTAVVTEELEGANCASVIVIRKGAFNSDWLCAAMNVWVGRQQVDLCSYGAAQKQFNVADAIEFVFPMPSSDEQDEIANFVEKALSRFNLLSYKADKQIELLQERRTALISAAVTGKIDVRDWQPVAA